MNETEKNSYRWRIQFTDADGYETIDENGQLMELDREHVILESRIRLVEGEFGDEYILTYHVSPVDRYL